MTALITERHAQPRTVAEVQPDDAIGGMVVGGAVVPEFIRRDYENDAHNHVVVHKLGEHAVGKVELPSNPNK